MEDHPHLNPPPSRGRRKGVRAEGIGLRAKGIGRFFVALLLRMTERAIDFFVD